MSDILEDLRQRLSLLGFVDPQIDRVVMDIRRDWAGERPYIGVRYEADRKISERNRSIIRDFKAGESIALLVRRYSLSRQRIWQIIKG
jgi:Mor family transcriptional regulator